jgi:hypothetical protein
VCVSERQLKFLVANGIMEGKPPDYAQKMHEKDMETLKPIIGLAERWLREHPDVLSKPKNPS